jgi:hypothetical protein
VHYIQDMVCDGVGSCHDLTHSDASSHTSWTLDNGQMSSHFADMVILVDRWAGNPHIGQCTPELVRH